MEEKIDREMELKRRVRRYWKRCIIEIPVFFLILFLASWFCLDIYLFFTGSSEITVIPFFVIVSVILFPELVVFGLLDHRERKRVGIRLNTTGEWELIE